VHTKSPSGSRLYTYLFSVELWREFKHSVWCQKKGPLCVFGFVIGVLIAWMLQGLSNAAEERGILELRERFLFMTSSLQMSTIWAETVNQAHSAAAHRSLSSPSILTAYMPLPISN
jgi:hypothetical protein